MIDWPAIAAIGAAAYFLGAVPFGLLLTRAAGLGDIRAIGSGNIGATNVLRTGRRGLAAATLLLDGGKGAAAALIARAVGQWGMASDLPLAPLAGLAAILGHVFPVWLGFRGGKGVATALGLWLALDWRIGALACLCWLLVALIWRFSSLAALVALAAAPLAAALSGEPAAAAAGALIAALVLWRHRPNISRLRAGTEPRIRLGRGA